MVDRPLNDTPTIENIELSSSQTTYRVMVSTNGISMKWCATKMKNGTFNSVVDIWCVDNGLQEYRTMKKIELGKIVKMVEEAVMNLGCDL